MNKGKVNPRKEEVVIDYYKMVILHRVIYS